MFPQAGLHFRELVDKFHEMATIADNFEEGIGNFGDGAGNGGGGRACDGLAEDGNRVGSFGGANGCSDDGGGKSWGGGGRLGSDGSESGLVSPMSTVVSRLSLHDWILAIRSFLAEGVEDPGDVLFDGVSVRGSVLLSCGFFSPKVESFALA